MYGTYKIPFFLFWYKTWINWNIFRWMISFCNLASPCATLRLLSQLLWDFLWDWPAIPVSVWSLTRWLVYRCDQHTAQHKEEQRRNVSLYFLIVTFLTNKWLLITDGHLRMERTRHLLQGFLCHWKSLHSLLLCKSVFYYSLPFLQRSPSCISRDPAAHLLEDNPLSCDLPKCWFVIK